jgi:hypothetical protein
MNVDYYTEWKNSIVSPKIYWKTDFRDALKRKAGRKERGEKKEGKGRKEGKKDEIE